MKKAMNRAVIYTRSIHNKDTNLYTLSYQQQLANCKAFACEHEMYVMECFHDDGQSEIDTARPALTTMLQFVAMESNIQVIVPSMDRLAVNPLLRGGLEFAIQLLGARIINISDVKP